MAAGMIPLLGRGEVAPGEWVVNKVTSARITRGSVEVLVKDMDTLGLTPSESWITFAGARVDLGVCMLQVEQ
jgi:hypothetical protein